MTHSRIAPEPIVAVLPALAALGAIASIAAAGWLAEYDAIEQSSDNTRKTEIALQELETSCVGLAEIFRRFQRHPELFTGDGRSAARPMKFGTTGARVSPEASKFHNRLMNDVAAMLVLATENAQVVMIAVEDGGLDAPDAVFNAFGECQDDLNGLFQSRASLSVCLDKGLEIADRLTALVRELKAHHMS